jgi:dTDP-4-dehydrorhamnose 3,5-epimerase
MTFNETGIPGAYVIEPRKLEDHRGFFARIWCRDEALELGLNAGVMQANMAFSLLRGTLRGLHFQKAPHAEVKVVRCTRGSVYDVIVDLRPESPACGRWFGVELSQENRRMLYVPEGCAQGYITLENDTEIYYTTSEMYHPESATGVRYDDPAFGIVWPVEPAVVSGQDRRWPRYSSPDLVAGVATMGESR